MKKIITASIIVIALLVTTIIFIIKIDKVSNNEKSEHTTSKLFNKKEASIKPILLDPKKEATHISKVADTPNVYWARGLQVLWNDIERKKGEFDWDSIDEMLGNGTYNIALVWPYANWDQKSCHSGLKYEATGHLKGSGELMMGAPCDMDAYTKFLEKAVERYDGDGIDDAPGLEIPIRYWEIMNEPSMQGGSAGGAGEDLKFFVGTPQEYFQILKNSYETIKKADPEAKVAHAGMAGMHETFVNFWTPIFESGAGNYFDIANIHAISVTEEAEDYYVTKFKRFLEKYEITNKPIWVTEAQVGELMNGPKDSDSFNQLIVRATIFSLVQGADKVFLIENWLHWDEMKSPIGKKMDKKDDGIDYTKKAEDKKMPKKNFGEVIKNNTTHQVYLNLSDKINSFDKIEIIKNEYIENKSDYQGATSKIAQYKFINEDKITYVLWGDAELPLEIKGTVKVTDIYGNSKTLDASAITLSNSPIFLEK